MNKVNQLNLPELRTKTVGPAVIVIPVANTLKNTYPTIFAIRCW